MMNDSFAIHKRNLIAGEDCGGLVSIAPRGRRKGKGSRYKPLGLMPYEQSEGAGAVGVSPRRAPSKNQNGFGGTTGFFWFRRCSRQVM